jgi:hypothetical protein
MKWIERTRLSTTIRRIYEVYEPHMKRTGKKPRFYAKDMLTKLTASKVTIIKARKALGIEARVVAGRHCWLFPKHTLVHALTSVGARIKVNTVERDVKRITPLLIAYFKKHGYDITAKQGRSFLKANGAHKNSLIAEIKRRTSEQLMHIKRTASGEIAEPTDKTIPLIEFLHPSRTKDHQFHWVLTEVEEVKDYLIELLHDGAKPYITLVKRFKAKGWSEDVLRTARTCHGGLGGIGGVEAYEKDRIVYWRDPVNESRQTEYKPDKYESIIDSGIATVVDEPSEDDWLPDSKQKRASRYMYLLKATHRDFNRRDDLTRYQKLMAKYYPEEWRILKDRQATDNSMQQEIERLNQKVEKLMERLGESEEIEEHPHSRVKGLEIIG